MKDKIVGFLRKFKKEPKTKRKRDLLDVSLRDLGGATKNLAKRVVVKIIKEW